MFNKYSGIANLIGLESSDGTCSCNVATRSRYTVQYIHQCPYVVLFCGRGMMYSTICTFFRCWCVTWTVNHHTCNCNVDYTNTCRASTFVHVVLQSPRAGVIEACSECLSLRSHCGKLTELVRRSTWLPLKQLYKSSFPRFQGDHLWGVGTIRLWIYVNLGW